MATYVMLSTLTDEGRKTLKARLSMDLGSRGTIKATTFPAMSIARFIDMMGAKPPENSAEKEG